MAYNCFECNSRTQQNVMNMYCLICYANNFKETCDIKSQVDDEQLSSTKPRRTDCKDLKLGGLSILGT